MSEHRSDAERAYWSPQEISLELPDPFWYSTPEGRTPGSFLGSRGITYTWPRNWSELIHDEVGDVAE